MKDLIKAIVNFARWASLVIIILLVIGLLDFIGNPFRYIHAR